MKQLTLSIAAIGTLVMAQSLNAQSLSEALQNGKISGDISITYEKRNMDKEVSTYYQDTAYSVPSIGIKYESASFYNFSLAVGFRAHKAIYEDDKDSTTSHGIGDATERFYDEDGNNILTDLYIAYDNNDHHVKVGRHYVSTDWLTKIIDGASYNAKLTDDLSTQLIFAKRRGRATAREVRHLTDINGNKGIYKVGLNYALNDSIKTEAYYLNAPTSHDIYGGKIKFDTNVNDIKYGFSLHGMSTSEDNNQDGNMIEAKAFTTISGFTGTLGYVKTDKENGWGSASDYGDLIVPFEEGDNMYKKNAETMYFMLSKSIGDVSLTGLYGTMSYDDGGQNFDSSEFNIWAGYKINKNLSVNFGYALVKEDNADTSTTDLDQYNMTVSYKF